MLEILKLDITKPQHMITVSDVNKTTGNVTKPHQSWSGVPITIMLPIHVKFISHLYEILQ